MTRSMLSHSISKEQPQNSDVSYRSCASLPSFNQRLMDAFIPTLLNQTIPSYSSESDSTQRYHDPASPTTRTLHSSRVLQQPYTQSEIHSFNCPNA
ncbi:hypothetical protein M413DRAFT_450000 [Hebeloma cylindrosporum]|uniref:Uncharacterized protein n=1 Tax=Hebeloma cylindrosporum TaxID=76867 RepID=A0A0C3BS54_HEBCY|nr:hypothetical protein M413DRAFT_450000 [Hebeloma cylindrosporum h7]